MSEGKSCHKAYTCTSHRKGATSNSRKSHDRNKHRLFYFYDGRGDGRGTKFLPRRDVSSAVELPRVQRSIVVQRPMYACWWKRSFPTNLP